jgi:hypothetical protein
MCRQSGRPDRAILKSRTRIIMIRAIWNTSVALGRSSGFISSDERGRMAEIVDVDPDPAIRP